MRKKILAIVGLVGVGVAGRLLPHLPNATPVTAITLAAGKHLGRLWSIVIPLMAMVISDSIIGFYNWRILLSVYGSFILIGCMSWLLRKHHGVGVSILTVVSASVMFFLITNFAVWIFSPWYEKSIAGLLYCYMLGLPFMRNMLIGDIFYSTLLLGAHQANNFRVLNLLKSLVMRPHGA